MKCYRLRVNHSPFLCSVQEWQKVAGKLKKEEGSRVWEKRGVRGRF